MAAPAKEDTSLLEIDSVAADDAARAEEWHAALDHAARVHRGGILVNEDERRLRAAAKVISQSRDAHFTTAILYRMAADLVARTHPMVIIDLLVAGPRTRQATRPHPRRRRKRAA